MSRASAVLGLAVWMLTVGACRGPGEREPGLPPLRVASDLDNPPFAFVDDAGTPGGRDVAMMNAVAEKLGRPIVWQRMAFDVLLDTVERGDVDIVCATLGVTPARLQRVAFSRPYFETVLAVVVRNGVDEPTSLADLARRAVHAAAGTTSAEALARDLPDARPVLERKEGQSTVDLLRSGQIDAAVMDGPAAAELVATGWGTLRILDEHLGAERYALALPREATELVAAVDAALAELRESGVLAEWDREYGLEPVKP